MAWLLGICVIISWYLTNEEMEKKRKGAPEARKATEYQSQNLNLISRIYCFLDPQSFRQFSPLLILLNS